LGREPPNVCALAIEVTINPPNDIETSERYRMAQLLETHTD
jgi:hypothetical protein